MNEELKKEKIVVVDFGSQVTKLIARRIRDFNVLSEIITISELESLKSFENIKGLILSGGPATVTSQKFPSIPKKVFP